MANESWSVQTTLTVDDQLSAALQNVSALAGRAQVQLEQMVGSAAKLEVSLGETGGATTALSQVMKGFQTEVSSVANSAARTNLSLQKMTSVLEDIGAATSRTSISQQNMIAELGGVNSASTRTAAALQSMTGALQNVTSAHSGAANGARAGARAHEQFTINTAGARRELIVLAHEMSQGNWSRFGGSIMVLAERTGGVTLATMGWAAAIAVVALAVGTMLAEEEALNEAVGQSAAALQNAGNTAQITDSQMREYITTLARLHGVSTEGAEAIAVSFARIGTVTPAMLANLRSALEGVTLLTGQEAPQAAELMAKALERPETAIQTLAQAHVHLSATAIEAVGAMVHMGDTAGAQAALAQALANAGQEAATHLTAVQDASKDAKNALQDLGTAFGEDSDRTGVLVDALQAATGILHSMRTPVIILSRTLTDFVLLGIIGVNELIIAIKQLWGAYEVAASYSTSAAEAAVQAARGNFSEAGRILAEAPDKAKRAWADATESIVGNTKAINDAIKGIAAPLSIPKPTQDPGEAPGGAPDGGGQNRVSAAEQVNEIEGRYLTHARDIQAIDADINKLQDQRKNVLADIAAAQGEQKTQLESQLSVLDQTITAAKERKSALEDKGGASQVSQWREQLQQRKATEDQFHAMSNADEAAFWQAKIALTDAGSKERTEVERLYYAAVARSRNDDQQHEEAKLKRDVEDTDKSLDQRRAALQAFADWAASQHASSAAAQEGIQNYLLEKNRQFAAEEVRIREKAINEQIQHEQRLLSARTSALQAAVNINAMTAEQGTTLTIQALDRQFAAEMAEYQRELQIQGLKAEDIDRINRQKEAAEDRYNQAILAQAEKAAQATENSWTRAIEPINRAMDQSVQGIIQGNQTASQAVARAATSMVASYAQSGVKMATDWLRDQILMTQETEVQSKARALIQAVSSGADEKTVQAALKAFTAAETAKTAASNAGAANRTAAGATENAGFFARVGQQVAQWLGLETAKTADTAAQSAERATVDATAATTGATTGALMAVLSISQQAPVAAAGAFASTAAIPIVGPELAPAAAAAAEAEVMAMAAMVPGFAVGAWSLPSDMIAQVHKGEMILPAPFAQSLRNQVSGGGGGGGDTHHWNISAIDAKSFQSFLKTGGGDVIVQHLQNKRRNFGM